MWLYPDHNNDNKIDNFESNNNNKYYTIINHYKMHLTLSNPLSNSNGETDFSF